MPACTPLKVRSVLVAFVAAIAVITLVQPPTLAADFVAFHADFTLDMVGEQPAASPPGDPPADIVSIYPTGSASALVYATHGLFTDKPILASRPAGSYLGVAFWFDPDYEACEAYTVSWQSATDGSVEFVYFHIRGASGSLICSLEYRLGGELTYNTVNNTLSVGYVANTPQHFEITVDNVARKTSLSIDGVPVPEAQNMNFSQTTTQGLVQYLGLSFGMQSDAGMLIDDVHVVAHCEGVAVESTSWGGVKSLYR